MDSRDVEAGDVQPRAFGLIQTESDIESFGENEPAQNRLRKIKSVHDLEQEVIASLTSVDYDSTENDLTMAPSPKLFGITENVQHGATRAALSSKLSVAVELLERKNGTSKNETVDPLCSEIHRHLYNDPNDGIEEMPANKMQLPRQRLVKRNLPFSQSLNKVDVKRRSKVRLVRTQSTPTHINTYMQRYIHQYLPQEWLPTHWVLFQRDWYHTFLRLRTRYSLLLLSSIWTFFIITFAFIYLAVDRAYSNVDCGLAVGLIFDFEAAFAFSLLTATTVGYTLPGGTNAFFQNCPGVQVSIYFQMLLSILFNAFLTAFLFTRIGRSETRAAQMLFAKNAIIRPITYQDPMGRKQIRWTLEVRVFDVGGSHPVVESHVRIYASFLPGSQNLRVCRLLRPDDFLNGWVFPSIPYSVVHEIDVYSPLVPPNSTRLRNEHKKWFIGWDGLERRESDSRTQYSYSWLCPTCSLSCGDLTSLMRHIKYMKLQDKFSKMPVPGSHQEIPDVLLEPQECKNTTTEATLRKHLENVEILCVVEGIDPITSGTFQALQSYTIEDLVFGGSFKPCIRLEGGKFVVDLNSFHRIVSDTQ